MALAVAVARPVLARFDRAATRRRLHVGGRARTGDGAPGAVTTLEESCAAFLDDVCRGLRGHHGLIDSVSIATHRHRRLGRWLSPLVVAAHDTGRFVVTSRDGAPTSVRRTLQRLALAAGAGTPSLSVLETGARDLRSHARHRANARAATAGVRSSVAMLSGLPVILLAGSVLVSPGVVGDALRRPTTVAVVVAGLALNQLGRLWMRRTVASMLP